MRETSTADGSLMRHVSLLVILMISYLSLSATPTEPASRAAAVVVELFTSEGCSSCPAADTLLNKLATEPRKDVEIIPLAWHVDYWNSLGWKDRFSSTDATRRQEEYARRFKLESTYTPQMIVGGTTEFVGSDRRRAAEAIAAAGAKRSAAKIEIQLKPVPATASSVAAMHVSVNAKDIAKSSGAKGELQTFVVITESGLSTVVKAGENANRTLQHTAVVRAHRVVPGTSGEAQFDLDSAWKAEGLRVVAFVQSKPAGPVLAAASAELPPP